MSAAVVERAATVVVWREDHTPIDGARLALFQVEGRAIIGADNFDDCFNAALVREANPRRLPSYAELSARGRL